MRYESTVPTAYRPDSTSAQVCGSFSRSHISLVPEKYGSRRSPVSSLTRSSWPSSRSRVHRSAVRRSCQTIALRGEPRVSRSHSSTVSRWLVMPTARSRPASWEARTWRVASRVACQISSGACSTQPGRGKCCANSW
ncbi:hypothetical protein ACVW2K_003641 [Nocardioides sp. HB32]